MSNQISIERVSTIEIKEPLVSATRLRIRRILSIIVPPVLVMLMILAIWQCVTMIINIPMYILPSPVNIGQAAVEHISELSRATLNTFLASLFGFLLSIVIGNGIALLMTLSKWIQRGLYPYAVVLQTIPIVAIAPLIVIWFGSGLNSVIIISFIIAVFPIISNTNIGLTSTDHNLIHLMRMYNGTGWKMLWKLRIPFAMPYILAGMKVSCGLAVIGAIIGEFVAGIAGAKGGLGIAITSAAVQMQTSYLFACAITASLLGMAFFLVISYVTHLILRGWHESAIQIEN